MPETFRQRHDRTRDAFNARMRTAVLATREVSDPSVRAALESLREAVNDLRELATLNLAITLGMADAAAPADESEG